MKPDESKEQKLPNDHKLHFGDYFSAPGVRILSVIIGLLIGCITSIFTGWQIGVLSGAVMVLIVSVVLPIILYRADVPYQKIKQTMPMRSDLHEYFMKDYNMDLKIWEDEK